MITIFQDNNLPCKTTGLLFLTGIYHMGMSYLKKESNNLSLFDLELMHNISQITSYLLKILYLPMGVIQELTTVHPYVLK